MTTKNKVRQYNRFKNWSKTMELSITKGECIFIARSMNMLDGANRTDSRLIVSIQEDFDLEKTAKSDEETTPEHLLDVYTFKVSKIQCEWLTDQINKRFEKHDVRAFEARYALNLEDKIKKLLEEYDEKEAEGSKDKTK